MPFFTDREREEIKQLIREDFTVARRWFWAAIGAAFAAGITQIVVLIITKSFR